MNEDTLKLSFDHNTIQHLGVSLYSQLPSVLSELISNSWDADANNISIEFNNDIKKITYTDDGHGMSFEELNNKYLVIGRNRRKESPQTSPNGREPIGKKGLGKLSVFGICDKVTIESVKDGKKNSFIMDLTKILSSTEPHYYPEIIEKNTPVTSEKNSIIIILEKIRRKSDFNIEEISESLAKKFIIYDKISVTLTDTKKSILITNEMKFNDIDYQFEWELPETTITESNYENKSQVYGKIITSKTPIRSSEMRGIYLTSRGKIVNQAEFYGARDNDQFHSYVTGYLSIDFIDENEIDLISTDRHSLNWENDFTKELKTYLQEVIKKIGADWRHKRAKSKKEELKGNGVDIDRFINNLGTHEKELGKKIIDPILTANNIDGDTTKKVVSSVIEKFNNKDFKDYASSIVQLPISADTAVKLLQYLDDWKVIENNQYAALAQTRISVIEKFEEYISKYTKEVPTMHNFLKQFPWLIDPRILEFQDEVHYSKVLKEEFPEKELEEKNRRIDFLCTNFLGGILYIIEIKHSEYEIDEKSLNQANEYQAFIKATYQTSESFSKVVAYVIGGSIKKDYKVLDLIDTHNKSGKVYVKTYMELLEQSKIYHKEFIEKHKELSNHNY